MNSIPHYYTVELAAMVPQRSQERRLPLGLIATTATFFGVISGIAYSSTSHATYVQPLQTTYPTTVRFTNDANPWGLPQGRHPPRLPLRNGQDDGLDVEVAEEGIAQEWPPHYVPPKTLAHPSKKAREDGNGLDVEVAEEGIAQEWPPHYLPPKSLAHPKKAAEAEGEGLDVELAEEMLAQGWPAHYPEPQKLARPAPKAANKGEEGFDAEVAEEGIAQEWPAHYIQPKKMGN